MFFRKRHWISWTRFRPDPTRPDPDLGAQFSYPKPRPTPPPPDLTLESAYAPCWALPISQHRECKSFQFLGDRSMIPNLLNRELGKPSDVITPLVRSQRYAARVMAALRRSLAKLMQRAAQGNVVAQYMVQLNLRAQDRWYDRSRPFY